MKEEKTPKTKEIYPDLKIEKNTKPNRLYAIPLISFLIKIVILLPIFIESFFLGIAFLFFWIGNSLVILFTGKYWTAAYDFFLGLMKFSTKIYLYMLGLADKYPSFGLNTDNLFELHIAKPENPNRLFAIPIFGLIARGILLIPYHIFAQVMQNGTWVAMCIAWFPILFNRKFPESVYEFEKDSIRVNLASFSYITGLSDKYPSFSISMNHQTIKILLIIAGALLTLNNFKGYMTRRDHSMYQYNQYNQNHSNYIPSDSNTMQRKPTQEPSESPKPTFTTNQIITTFEKEAQTLTVANIFKSPNSYKGKPLIFTCSVTSFPKDENGDVAGINCDDPNSYGSNVQVEINKSTDITKINEKDIIKVYGMGAGTIKGQNAFGANITTGGIIGLYINDLTTGYKNY